jgi:probable rRNA maturation factor
MIDVEVEDAAWTAAIEAVVALTQQAAGAAARLGNGGAIAVLLTGDAVVRDLNARFRHQDRATNVLSFPAGEHARGQLGDIALAFGVCEQEARAQAKPLEDHLRHLVIHGVLHLLGYDHQSEDQASRMESVERHLLAGMDIPDPYSDRVERMDDGRRRP